MKIKDNGRFQAIHYIKSKDTINLKSLVYKISVNSDIILGFLLRGEISTNDNEFNMGAMCLLIFMNNFMMIISMM